MAILGPLAACYGRQQENAIGVLTPLWFAPVPAVPAGQPVQPLEDQMWRN
jgi:hypothetical protein